MEQHCLYYGDTLTSYIIKKTKNKLNNAVPIVSVYRNISYQCPCRDNYRTARFRTVHTPSNYLLRFRLMLYIICILYCNCNNGTYKHTTFLGAIFTVQTVIHEKKTPNIGA